MSQFSAVPAIGIGAMARPGIAGLLSQSGNPTHRLTFVGATTIVSAFLITGSARRARPGSVQQRI